jgi:CubicO group peptidase (beta-lactamase class C family)
MPKPPTERSARPGVFAPSADYAVLQLAETELAFVHGVTRLAYSLRIPVAGDFDGDGFDSIATYDVRSGELFVKDTNAEGVDAETHMLTPGRWPIAGDFDRDGKASIALYDPATATFDVDGEQLVFGPPRSIPIAGDFDGDGFDTVGVYDPASRRVLLRGPEIELSLGVSDPSALPFAGDLDGDGIDNPGLYSAGTFHAAVENVAGTAISVTTFGGTALPYMPLVGVWQQATPTPPREGYDWPRATPASAGIDDSELASAYQFARTMPGVHAALVLRGGKLVAEEYFNGYTASTPQCIKSVSKSMLSMLYGAAWGDGLIAMETPLVQYLPAIASDSDPRRGQILVGHMLSMTAGLSWTENDATFWPSFIQSKEPTKFIAGQPMIATPGATFHYNTGLTVLAAHVLDDLTPGTLLDYARERVFSRIGIDIQRWDRDAEGYLFGGTEMYMPPRDLARLGELYLRDGNLDGDQVIPVAWAQTSPKPIRDAYGAYWWNRTSGGHEVFHAWGYGGQMVFVVRALDLVVVVTHVWDVSGEVSGANAERAFALLDRIVAAAQ